MEKRQAEDLLSTPTPKRGARRQTAHPTPQSIIETEETTDSVPFDLGNLLTHNNWVGIVRNYAWRPKTSNAYELCNSLGKPLTVLIFGKVTNSRAGRYGDFTEVYHQSLISPGIRNLVWKLGPPEGYADDFYKQFNSIHEIEDNLDATLDFPQRAGKSASDIELKRKIAKKLDSTTAIIPDDDGEQDYWKKYLTFI
jgi:hypothetical protein